SDMSGWLLMGLPGVAYWFGLSDKKIIMTIAALIILVFFSVYAASCFVTVGKLFSTLFDVEYLFVMIAGALFVIFYTFIGGFLAESASDFMQGLVMIFALTVVVITGVVHVGGISAIVENAKNIPGFFDFFGIAQPTVVDGVQQIGSDSRPLFGEAGKYGLLTIISTLSWGLGYFGMPQVLLKFMAIRKPTELKLSRRIAVVWVVISLSAAVFIGIIGRLLYPDALLTQSAAESIFILMSTSFFIPLIAGIVMAGILAATISSSDSYLLIAASAFSKSIYQGIIKKDANDRTVLFVSRVALIVIAIIAMIIASDENSVIFTIVSFAWAGFGATFGPLMLFSLFWKRVTRSGAIAGMLVGGGMVFIWKLLLKPLGGVFGIYELLPAFVLSCIAIVIVSLLSKEPSPEIQAEFELVKSSN
ncbi:MAG: sodium/proline symporter, partial [Peptococcaceae bacterium]|nr:sodium/proline symporter [Peptococcaceae bacterium]